MPAPGRLLLVTGSRALDDTDEARAWGMVVVARAVAGLGHDDQGSEVRSKYQTAAAGLGAGPGPRVVLTGGCPRGPDRYATIVAAGEGLGVRVVEYRLDGRRWELAPGTPLGRLAAPGAWSSRPWRDGPATHPHERNRALVAAAGRALAAGWSVQVLAVLAPWSPTRGAYVTAELAEAAGLLVARAEAPGRP